MRRFWSVSLSILALVILLFGVSLLVFLNLKLKGKIISGATGEPIDKAFVVVRFTFTAGPTGTRTVHVQTKEDGTFETEFYPISYSISAWKSGYAENGCYTEICKSENGEIILKLREIVISNFVSENESFFDFDAKKGFSLVKGRAVNAQSADADIIFVSGANDEMFIETPERAGICFKPLSETSEGEDFYSPAAPADDCYQQRVTLDKGGVYFVKTRDKSYYAKFRIFPTTLRISDNKEKMFMKESHIIWAYQPDGTRNLEITPPEGVPSTFSEFYKSNADK